MPVERVYRATSRFRLQKYEKSATYRPTALRFTPNLRRINIFVIRIRIAAVNFRTIRFHTCNVMTEFGLIEQISKMFATIPANGFEGIGDDCAVLPIGDEESLVFTADMLAGILPEDFPHKDFVFSSIFYSMLNTISYWYEHAYEITPKELLRMNDIMLLKGISGLTDGQGV